ncbi:hypothetical protein LTR27_000185 [Elasticomyces elasticus]|nr:hypothetical protein LTR27_000185 [Elasticomyces elasticus]
MAQNDQMSATELREQIKENAVVLFPAAVSELHSQRPFAPATEAFLVLITHDPDRQSLYGAGISLQQNPVGIKWMARTLDQPSMIEALRALLETTAHAILCSDGDEGNRAEWGQYGRGWVRDG